MSTNITFNGTTYAIPAVGDSNWGTVLSNYFIALSTGALSKAGGTFSLTADVDFGSSFGLKSAYFKTRSANPSATGLLRLSNTEAVSWRNAASGADLQLLVNALNQLTFNGRVLDGPLVVGTKASPYAVVAGTTLPLAGNSEKNIKFIQGSGGAVVSSATPAIAAGTFTGQKLMLWACDDTNTVTLKDQADVPGNTLEINGTWVGNAGSKLNLVWDDGSGLWSEESRSER